MNEYLVTTYAQGRGRRDAPRHGSNSGHRVLVGDHVGDREPTAVAQHPNGPGEQGFVEFAGPATIMSAGGAAGTGGLLRRSSKPLCLTRTGSWIRYSSTACAGEMYPFSTSRRISSRARSVALPYPPPPVYTGALATPSVSPSVGKPAACGVVERDVA